MGVKKDEGYFRLQRIVGQPFVRPVKKPFQSTLTIILVNIKIHRIRDINSDGFHLCMFASALASPTAKSAMRSMKDAAATRKCARPPALPVNAVNVPVSPRKWSARP
ncbi:hypothetical protein EMIT0194P_50122 [Pseudomonas serbica]